MDVVGDLGDHLRFLGVASFGSSIATDDLCLDAADGFAGDLLQRSRQLHVDAEDAGSRRACRTRVRVGYQEERLCGGIIREVLVSEAERLDLPAADSLAEVEMLIRLKNPSSS
jgi:hypothetical protein